MAVSFVVILMVLFTSVLKVDGSSFSKLYSLQKALESVLITEEILYTMRQTFFPVIHVNGQEVQQVCISVCVHIAVDQTLNSSSNASCVASGFSVSRIDGSNNVSSLCWKFLWTDSALLSLITIDQLVAFDALAVLIHSSAIGKPAANLRKIDISLPLICHNKLEISVIKTSLMLLLSWSKSYVRHHGVPPQWEETDKGYIQELYDDHYVAESTYNENDVHLIRLGLTISYTLLNIVVLIGVLAYGKNCYLKVYVTTLGSTRLITVTWASMITALIINSSYLFWTVYGFARPDTYPRVLSCLISEAGWCNNMKSTKLYSDVLASLLVKLIVVSFTIVVELIIAVRLTSHTLLPLPCKMVTRSQCCSFRNSNRVVQTILIWNVIVLIQLLFGAALIPVAILMVIAPLMTFSCTSVLFGVLPVLLIAFIANFILRWCNPISFMQCCSIFLCVHVFTTSLILSLLIIAAILYYYVILLGVEPWSVKGSILSFFAISSSYASPVACKELYLKERKFNGISLRSVCITL